MFKASINKNKVIDLEIDKSGKKVTINNNLLDFEIVQNHKNILQVLTGNKSYEVLILKFNAKDKTALIKVNGNKYEIELKDKYDQLLHKLGFDLNTTKKISNIKAPMPGLVLNVMVTEGLQVKKGDALVVLEAMKMENILKSPIDGLIKKVSVKKGIAVEKNQVLIEF